MTDALSPTVPAGWYPDPWGSASQRWWDGSAWSDDVTAPPALDSPYPSRRALRHSAISEDGTTGEQTAGDSGWTTPDLTALAAPTGAAFTAEPLPAFTQVPQFTPEPVSALPPPVWTEPEPQLPAPTPAAGEAPAVPEPAATVPADEAPVAPEPAATMSTDPVPSVEAPVAPEPVAEAPTVVAATTAPQPATSVPGVPASVPDPDDDWAASLAGWDDIDTSDITPPDARPIFGDAPPVSYSQRAVRYQPLHGRTSPVWLIVIMPLVHAAALVGSLFLFPRAASLGASLDSFRPGSASLAALSEWLMFAAAPLGIAFFLFTLIMGFQDRARLRLLGHDQTASPWWIVLHPLVYLIVRSIRVRQCTGRRGSGPLTTYLCFYVAPPIALVVATAVISALDGAIPA